MTLKEHATERGGLVLNFHSLEFILRGLLQNLPKARPIGLEAGVSFYTVKVGDTLPENDITSYESLGDLIKRYNHEAVSRNLGKPIDATLVNIRDAIAHGRVSTQKEDQPMQLIKFERPINGRVRVSLNEVMTKRWFVQQHHRINEAMSTVHASYLVLTKGAGS